MGDDSDNITVPVSYQRHNHKLRKEASDSFEGQFLDCVLYLNLHHEESKAKQLWKIFLLSDV